MWWGCAGDCSLLRVSRVFCGSNPSKMKSLPAKQPFRSYCCSRRAPSSIFTLADRTLKASMRRVCRRLCPAAPFTRLFQLLTLEKDEFNLETGHMRPLWRAWQRDAETAAAELERDSGLEDLALRGECSRAEILIYLFVFWRKHVIYVHLNWHVFAYVLTNSWQHFSPSIHTPNNDQVHLYFTYKYVCVYVHKHCL